MDWTLLTAFASWIPTTAVVGFLMQYQKKRFDRSLEKLKTDLQVDVVRFSKWHEKRVSALEEIYLRNSAITSNFCADSSIIVAAKMLTQFTIFLRP